MTTNWYQEYLVSDLKAHLSSGRAPHDRLDSILRFGTPDLRPAALDEPGVLGESGEEERPAQRRPKDRLVPCVQQG